MNEYTFASEQSTWVRPFNDVRLLTDPHQREVYDYWAECDRDGDLPLPDKIDPLAFTTGVLPFLVVEERVDSTGRYRTRLAGTAYQDAVGYEGTNLYTDETDGTEDAVERLQWMADHRQPYWYRGPCTFSYRPWSSFSVLSLPFAYPGQPVSRALCIFDFAPEPG